MSEALRPAETTDDWAGSRAGFGGADIDAALAGVTLIEAPSERDEAAAIAIALRRRSSEPGGTAALVTGDRDLARRVSAELLRFGIRADDSGGTPLANTPPGALLRLLLEAVFRPGNPVPMLALLKHPLLPLGLERARVRHAAETIELVALRGGTGRPDVADARRACSSERLVADGSASRSGPRASPSGGSPPRGTCCAGWPLRCAPLAAFREQPQVALRRDRAGDGAGVRSAWPRRERQPRRALRARRRRKARRLPARAGRLRPRGFDFRPANGPTSWPR